MKFKEYILGLLYYYIHNNFARARTIDGKKLKIQCNVPGIFIIYIPLKHLVLSPEFNTKLNIAKLVLLDPKLYHEDYVCIESVFTSICNILCTYMYTLDLVQGHKPLFLVYQTPYL